MLGAVAASSQLIQQGYSIIRFLFEAYSDVQKAPDLVLSRFRQVEQLIGAEHQSLSNRLQSFIAMR